MPAAQLFHRKIHSSVRGVGKQEPTAPTAALSIGCGNRAAAPATTSRFFGPFSCT